MIGQTISHYKILEKLGEGGMGVVYKAEDAKLRRSVALKFLAPEMTRDQEAKRRFIQEAQAASALDHPNIAVVHEIDETDDGRSFICMAFYDGETLKEKIQRGPLDVEQASRIAIQILDGLQRAHEAGIVHRDIKPANVIVTHRSEVKIVDFGLAKLAGQTKLMRAAPRAGTTAYMSPEQATGDSVDHRSDLFSLGIVLYEMVTGKHPFLAEHELALLYLIINVDPVPPSALRPDLPKEVEQVILRLLQKDPAKRYQSAAEVQSELKRSIGLMESTQQSAMRQSFTTIRRLGIPLSIAMIALLLFVTPIRTIVERWLGVESVSPPKHLVVLPFTNVGNDSSNQAFCDGLMETLTSVLTQMRVSQESFWVVAASEIRQRKISSPSEALRAFGARLAITGSVQREGNAVRLIVNLVDTKTSRQLKSKVISDRTAALSGLQDETVVKLAELLDIKLQPQELRTLIAGGTEVSKAYDFYLQARGYLYRFERVENISMAIGLFERALKEDSAYALAYAGLGEAYWRKYDATKDVHWIDLAVKNGRRAVELNDQLPPAHITLGMIYKGTGRYEDAVKEFLRTLEFDSLNADAHRELAGAYEALGDFEKAEVTYKKAIDLRPDYWAGYNKLGGFYSKRKRYKEAAEQFKGVIKLTPDNVLGYTNLGAMYYALNLWVDARSSIENALTIEPNYGSYSNLGTLYFYERRYTDAARMYEKALTYQPLNYRVWGYLASTYFMVPSEREKATEAFQRAAQLAEEQRQVDPRDANLLSFLAGYYVKLGKKPEAFDLVKQALTLAPGDLQIMVRAASVYDQLGKRELALKWIGEALNGGALAEEFTRDPDLQGLQSDIRFQRLLQKNNDKH